MRIAGSQTLGGSTVKSSEYSSMPATMSLPVLALYATSQNTYTPHVTNTTQYSTANTFLVHSRSRYNMYHYTLSIYLNIGL